MTNPSLKPLLIESIPRLRGSKPKIWVEGYGCSASTADFEMIKGILKEAGYGMAANVSESALSIIVTCSVKDRTEHRMVHRIKRLAGLQKPLIVAGCLPKADERLVRRISPQASLMGPDSIERTAEIVDRALAGSITTALDGPAGAKLGLPKVRLNEAVAIVEIASGCLSECSFCQTKLAKGELRSYRPIDICDQIEREIAEGCREIWLTSTDNGCYGRDIGTDLADLVVRCSRIKPERPASGTSEFMVRVGMLNPMYLPPIQKRLIEAFRNDRIFKFLHVPVQSGSDSVLKKMKRGHTAETFLKTAAAFRSSIPETTIATDIIVGFPSETTRDFELTLDLLRQSEPDIINISRFSARPGTSAAKMRPRADSSEIKRRTVEAHALARELMTRRNSGWLGWAGRIIIDEIDDHHVQGRNLAYKPVVLENPPLGIKLGKFVDVRISDYTPLVLRGRVT